MSIKVNLLSEYNVQSFVEEYDNFIEETGMTEYAFGYALAKSYINPSPKNTELLKFILDNRYLFVKAEEAENACDVQS